MKYYKTKKEAQLRASELEGNYLQETFCPLINSSCRFDCVAYNGPKIFNNTNGYYILYEKCSAHCLKGDL